MKCFPNIPRPIEGVMQLTAFALFPILLATSYAQSTDYRQEVEQVRPCVVTISGQTDDGDLVGSGFLMDSKGTIGTSLHVLRPLKTVKVKLASGETYDSIKVKAFDERRDLAIIRVAGFDLPACRLGSSNDVRPGDPALLVGAGNRLEGSVTSGIVSAIRDVPEGFKVIQTDAAANPGNSGGPLFNSRSEVIGILGFKLKGSEGQNFAIPINYARGLLESATADLDLSALRANPMDSVAQSGASRRVDNLRAVKTVYVDEFGKSEGAFLVREKLINRLTGQPGLEVVPNIQDADSLLTGFVGTNAYGHADATILRLLGKAGKTLWSGEYNSSVSVWRNHGASSSIADKAAKDLLRAVKDAR